MSDRAPAFPLPATGDHQFGDQARELIATYAFMGPGIELDRTRPLHEGEQSIIAGRVVTKYRGHGLMAIRRGFLRLSTERLCIVRQYGFPRDRIIEIPRAAITDLSVEKSPLHVGFRGRRRDDAIEILTAAEVSRGDSRGTVKQTTVDVLALQFAGIPKSLKGIGVALASWSAHADD